MQQELDSMRKALVLRNYATRTVDTYVSLLKRYLGQLDKPIEDVTLADVMAWQYTLVERKMSWSQFNQAVCALKFYFKHVRNVRVVLRAHPLPTRAQTAADCIE